MARNGSGTYTRTDGVRTGSTVFAQQQSAGTDMLASLFDTEAQDMADALTDSIAKTGVTTPTANLPMGSFLHTGVGNATARTHYGVTGQIQDSSYLWGGTSGGSANVQTLTLTPAITAYVAGQKYHFLAGFSNTAAATLNINAVGAKDLVKGSTATPQTFQGGELLAGQIVEVVYDSGGSGRFHLVNNAFSTTDHTPTYSTGGSAGPMTISGTGTAYYKYTSNGGLVFFTMAATFTLGGTANRYVTFTLPYAAADVRQALTGVIIDNATDPISAVCFTQTTTVVSVGRYDQAVWTIGAGKEIRVSGFYYR